MTRVTHLMTTQSLLADVNNAASRLDRTQHKLSTGKEIQRPSDDPLGTNRALALRTDVEGLRQYQDNVADGVAWQTVADTALFSVNNLIHTAKELAVQGASDTVSDEARENLADQVDGIAESLKDEANRSYAGNYVFSGTATGTRPYTPGAVDTYGGDAGSYAREIGPGVSVKINTLGSDILGGGTVAADDKLLHVLRDLSANLRASTPASMALVRSSDLARLDTNLASISRLQSGVGATVNRLETAGARLAEIEESSSRLLSETEDADMAKAMIDYSMQKSVYQSVLKAGANTVQVSLMDFLR